MLSWVFYTSWVVCIRDGVYLEKVPGLFIFSYWGLLLFVTSRVNLFETKKELKMMTNQKKVLRRSRSNRILAGVCGGLAEFFGISSFWFRLGMLISFIPGGVPGVLLYILLWVIIPSE